MAPTTTKSTPWATSRLSSASSLNSGQLATTPRACQGEGSDFRVAVLERLEAITGWDPQMGGNQRLVNA
jgi:hypothetical protein